MQSCVCRVKQCATKKEGERQVCSVLHIWICDSKKKGISIQGSRSLFSFFLLLVAKPFPKERSMLAYIAEYNGQMSKNVIA